MSHTIVDIISPLTCRLNYLQHVFDCDISITQICFPLPVACLNSLFVFPQVKWKAGSVLSLSHSSSLRQWVLHMASSLLTRQLAVSLQQNLRLAAPGKNTMLRWRTIIPASLKSLFNCNVLNLPVTVSCHRDFIKVMKLHAQLSKWEASFKMIMMCGYGAECREGHSSKLLNHVNELLGSGSVQLWLVNSAWVEKSVHVLSFSGWSYWLNPVSVLH